MTIASCDDNTIARCNGVRLGTETIEASAFPYVFTPAQVAELSGVDPEAIRVWRNRQLIGVYGHQKITRHWAYSLQDATGFFIARRLILARVDRADALRLGYSAAPSIIAAMRGEPFRTWAVIVYTISTTSEHDGEFDRHGYERVDCDTLAELDGAVMIERALNVANLAGMAPKALRDAARIYPYIDA